MLIGTRAFNLGQVDKMRRLSDEIGDRTTAIATSRRWQVGSEDPSAAQQTAALARRQADGQRYDAGLDFAEQRLTVADDAAGGMVASLTRLKELAILAANETTGGAGRQALATEAREIVRAMVGMANAQDASGNYLFAGARAAQAAFGFDATSGAVVYQGLGRAADVAIGPGAELAATEPGDRLFGGFTVGTQAATVFSVAEGFIAALENPPVPGDDASLAAYRAAMDLAVDGSDAAIQHLATQRAAFGGRLNRIETERDSLALTQGSLTEARSRLEGADLAEEITLLQRAQTVLQAAQRSFVQVSSLGLFNELR